MKAGIRNSAWFFHVGGRAASIWTVLCWLPRTLTIVNMHQRPSSCTQTPCRYERCWCCKRASKLCATMSALFTLVFINSKHRVLKKAKPSFSLFYSGSTTSLWVKLTKIDNKTKGLDVTVRVFTCMENKGRTVRYEGVDTIFISGGKLREMKRCWDFSGWELAGR